MKLILFHPGPAATDCDTCVKHVMDLDHEGRVTGKTSKYMGIDPADGERKELPQIRPQGTLPPCQRCPKGSPEQAKEMELSEKNWMALAFYRQEKAMGVRESIKSDPIVRRNFEIIDDVHQSCDALQGARLQANEFAKLFRK